MAFWENPAVAGALGIVVGGATAYIQSALAARSKAGGELRTRRLETYPEVWRETATMYRDAPAELRWADLEPRHLAFRRWYFTTGGLYLSRRSTARLNDLQSLLSAYLSREHEPEDLVGEPHYTHITETCSAFRSALTQDLATRQQRSLAWALMDWRWHRLAERDAERRIKAVGQGKAGYPLEKLDLEPPALEEP